jgi:hypothetical protein
MDAGQETQVGQLKTGLSNADILPVQRKNPPSSQLVDGAMRIYHDTSDGLPIRVSEEEFVALVEWCQALIVIRNRRSRP